MNTLRPVKRFDSDTSNRASLDFASSRFDSVRNLGRGGEKKEDGAAPATATEAEGGGGGGVLGEAIMKEVVRPTLEKATKGGQLKAGEVEALHFISNGFAELVEGGNPELAYKILVDLAAGIDRCVYFFFPFLYFRFCGDVVWWLNCLCWGPFFDRNKAALRQLSPELEADKATAGMEKGLPMVVRDHAAAEVDEDESDEDGDSDGGTRKMRGRVVEKRSAIAEMLYARREPVVFSFSFEELTGFLGGGVF
jgi:hypothetical protein